MKKLNRFSEYITRIEVHLSDENGGKEGQNDKRCMIEARLEGRQPITVKAHADSHEQSVADAIEKLKNSPVTILRRLRNH
jgi:non-homologous end joining protein Ku